MRTLFIINCVTPGDSQTIATATYSLNGNDMGTAVFPLSLAVSSLSPGENAVVVLLEGSGGSTLTVRFNITLVVTTPEPPTDPILSMEMTWDHPWNWK
jgi:hypothetical protein